MPRVTEDAGHFEETLRVTLTIEEVAERSDEVARKLGERDDIEARKKASASAAKESLERLDAELRELAREVRERATYRPVDCREIRDESNHRFNVVRLDTGEVVRSRPMTEAERQRSLFSARAAESSGEDGES